MKHIGSSMGGCVQFRRNWFELVDCPTLHELDDLGDIMPKQEKYTLWEPNLPKEVMI